MLGRELIALNVRKIRVARGLSQERLAYDAGVDRSYLGGVERAEANPTIDVLDRIAGCLGVGVGELFAEGDATSPSELSLRKGRKRR
jgi:transcriptional regulator with XRE-family HTH domain